MKKKKMVTWGRRLVMEEEEDGYMGEAAGSTSLRRASTSRSMQSHAGLTPPQFQASLCKQARCVKSQPAEASEHSQSGVLSPLH
jgi:hypothetical protein